MDHFASHHFHQRRCAHHTARAQNQPGTTIPLTDTDIDTDTYTYTDTDTDTDTDSGTETSNYTDTPLTPTLRQTLTLIMALILILILTLIPTGTHTVHDSVTDASTGSTPCMSTLPKTHSCIAHQISDILQYIIKRLLLPTHTTFTHITVHLLPSFPPTSRPARAL